MPSLFRDAREGWDEENVHTGLAPLFVGRAEMRAEVASYSVQLTGKGLLWLRWKEEASKGCYW